jgi:hypothetical protein
MTTYAARSQLDQRQLAALVRAVPAKYLPGDAYLVPVHCEEPLFAGRDTVNLLLTGVLETPWSAHGALSMAYRRRDFVVHTSNRWLPMTFTRIPGTDRKADGLKINGTRMPLERTILFTYRDGKGCAIENLTLSEPDGSLHRLHLPAADRLRRHGLPTTDLLAAATPEPG